jgi:hypothetical protein
MSKPEEAPPPAAMTSAILAGSGAMGDYSSSEGNPQASMGNTTQGDIGIGGAMLGGLEGQSIALPFEGVGLGEILKKIGGALSAAPTDFGKSMDPIGVEGAGITNKDLQGAGSMGLDGAALPKGFNAPAGGVGIPGISQGGGR